MRTKKNKKKKQNPKKMCVLKINKPTQTHPTNWLDCGEKKSQINQKQK